MIIYDDDHVHLFVVRTKWINKLEAVEKRGIYFNIQIVRKSHINRPCLMFIWAACDDDDFQIVKFRSCLHRICKF